MPSTLEKIRILGENYYEKYMATILKPLIELIKPNLIIVLGYEAYLGVSALYGVKQQKDMKSAVRTLMPLNRDTELYTIYHCGARTTNVNRPWEDMKKDWNLLKVQFECNF